MGGWGTCCADGWLLSLVLVLSRLGGCMWHWAAAVRQCVEGPSSLLSTCVLLHFSIPADIIA